MRLKSEKYKGIDIRFEKIPKDNICVFESYTEARTKDGIFLGSGYNKLIAFEEAKNTINKTGLTNLKNKDARKRILNNVNTYGKPEEQALVEALLNKYDFTNEQLQNFDWRSNLDYKTSAEEYISISIHASVWTRYVGGTITILGKKYYAKAQYESDVNRV